MIEGGHEREEGIKKKTDYFFPPFYDLKVTFHIVTVHGYQQLKHQAVQRANMYPHGLVTAQFHYK